MIYLWFMFFNDAIYREILLREIQGNRIARLRPIASLLHQT